MAKGKLERAVYIFSELFHPDETSTAYILTEVAGALASRREVHVISGPANYQANSTVSNKELPAGIKVRRLSMPNFNKDSVSGRMMRMIIMTLKMSVAFIKKVKRGDTVLIVTNPAPLLLLITFLKRIIRVRLIILVHDVFPENAVSVGMLKPGSLVVKILRFFYNASYRSADKLIVLGADMKDLMYRKTKHTDINIIPNWADVEEIFPDNTIRKNITAEVPGNSRIVIQFAGNIGRLQGLMEFIRVFHKAGNKNLLLTIIGSGALKPAIEEYIKEEGIDNIILLKQFPRQEQNTYLNSCDIALVSLAKGMYGLGVPSKSYNIMAAAKPILFVGDKNSEIYNCISQHNAGWVFDWEEQDRLLHFLRGLSASGMEEIRSLGENGYHLALHRFSKDTVLGQFQNIVLEHA